MLRAARQIVDRFGTLPLRIGVNSRPGLRRRLRPAVPPHVLGQGRRHQPRRPGDGQGAAGPAARHRRRVLDALAPAVRVEPLAALPWSRESRRPSRRPASGSCWSRRTASRHPTRRWSAATDELARLLAALDRARSGRGSRGRAVGRAGDRQVPARPGAAARDGPRHVRQPVRRVRVGDGVLAVPRAAARGPRVPPGTARTRRSRRSSRDRGRRLAPDAAAVAAAVGRVLDVDMPPTPEVDALAERFRKAAPGGGDDRAPRSALLAEPAVLVFDDAHLMDDASADLLEQLSPRRRRRPVARRRHPARRRRRLHGVRAVPRWSGSRPPPLDTAVRSARRRRSSATSAAAARTRGRARRARQRQPAVPARARPSPPAAGTTVDALPATVEALITSQIDRLPPDERTVLRFASVLGCTFHESELRALLEDAPCPPAAERCAGCRTSCDRRATADTASSTSSSATPRTRVCPTGPTRPARARGRDPRAGSTAPRGPGRAAVAALLPCGPAGEGLVLLTDRR